MNRFMLTRRLYGNDSPPVVPPAVPPTVPPPPPAGKYYTQEELNTLMANNRKQLQQEYKQTVQMLEEAKSAAGLSKQQVDDLQTRIDTLTAQTQSETEQLKSQLTKTQKESKSAIEAAEAKATKATKDFHDLMVSHAIHTASSEHGAVSATQMQAMFGHQSKVTPVVDEQGAVVPDKYVVKLPVVVPDGKKGTKIVEMDVKEAFGTLREQDGFKNLFQAQGVSGLGGSTKGGTHHSTNGTPNFNDMSPEDFMKWRNEQKKNPS